MTERRDYLPVCNDLGVRLPDFQAMFCVRCVQRECTRSRGDGLFETRVATWQDRLFRNPARMDKSDPLYPTLAAKRFVEIDTSRIPEINGRSEWVDPRALEEPPVAKPRPAKAGRAVPPAPPTDAGPEVENPSPPAEPVTPRQPRGEPLNTPFERPVMLGSAPATRAEEVVDR